MSAPTTASRRRFYVRGQRNNSSKVLSVRCRKGQLRRRLLPRSTTDSSSSSAAAAAAAVRSKSDTTDEENNEGDDEYGLEWLATDEEVNDQVATASVRDFYGGRARVTMEPIEEEKESSRFLRIKSTNADHPELVIKFQTLDEMCPALLEFLEDHHQLIDESTKVVDLHREHEALARYDLSLLWSLYYVATKEKRIRPGMRMLRALYLSITNATNSAAPSQPTPEATAMRA